MLRAPTSGRIMTPVRHAAVLLLTAVSAQAQPVVPPLTSNRPGIADSEALVPPGAIQLETGVQGQGAAPGSDRRWSQTWGQLTGRYGLTARLELSRAGTDCRWTGFGAMNLDWSAAATICALARSSRCSARSATA